MPFKLSQPVRQLTLTKFGGLYLDADARQLPAGASPQNWDVDFIVAGLLMRPGLSLDLSIAGGGLMQWMKSAALNATQYTFLQDATGHLYSELVSTGAVTTLYSGIINNARAISTSANNREYFGLSNLVTGSDQPRQWDGTNLDRISQVGPGQPPSSPSTGGTQYNITSIKQNWPAVALNSIAWGSSLNLYNAQPASQNLYFLGAPGSTTFTTGLKVGDTVYVSGAPSLDGQNPNGTYTVTSIGSFTDVDGVYQYFQVVSDVTNSDFARGTATGTYQKTSATVLLGTPLPAADAVVGTPITIAGASIGGWNSNFKITATPAEGQLSINATSLAANVATYTYSLQTGTAPGWQPSFDYLMGSQIVDNNGTGHVWQVTTAGVSGSTMPTFPATPSGPVTDGGVTWTYQSGATMTVIVFNTTNGDGIFNIDSLTITGATSTTFTVALTSGNIGAGAEEGEAVSGSGSVLTIDPGLTAIGTGHPGTDPIYGNATGGTVVSVGNTEVAPGPRYAVCMFQTRNGAITPASPPVLFYTTGSTGTVTFTNVPLGPPDVIARIIALSAAEGQIGGPFYYIPTPVTVPGTAASLGQSTTYPATVINDNTSTTLGPIVLSDAILLAGVQVSVPGNNVQQQRELAEYVKSVWFRGRMFYMGERTKTDTLVNMTFDGGALNSIPVGWSLNGGIGSYLSIIPSPIVNSSLLISNPSSSAVTTTQANFNYNINTSTYEINLGSVTAGNTVVIVANYETGATSAPYTTPTPPTPPVGFTKIASYSNGTLGVTVFKKILTENESGIYSFTFPAGSNAYTALSGFLFSGNQNALQVSGGPLIFNSPYTTATTDAPLPAISTGGSILWFGCTHNMQSLIGTPTLPAGYTELVDENTGQGFMLYASDQTIVAGAPSLTGTAVSGNTGNPPQFTLWVNIASNPGSTLNPSSTPTGYLSQTAYQNFAFAPIVQPNVAYSVRMTAALTSGSATQGNLVIDLYSPSLATNWPVSIALTSLGTGIKEFTGAFSNPLWSTVPSDLVLRVYPSNVAAGTGIIIDRIEIFPTNEPTYTAQVYGSYIENPEAIDAITGAVDISEYENGPITNHFTFLDRYYITTAGHTYYVTDLPNAEPSGWAVQQVDSTVGCIGPLAASIGQEYFITAVKDGLYLFDGGNHIKLSQEIQPIWNSIYWPSASSIWVQNDIANQRMLVGVPLPTPNTWLPNAPTNATPSTPNVILMCSYLGLGAGREIAESQAVRVSMFTGQLLYRDISRKWTIWQIPAPYSAFITRSNGTLAQWFGSAAQTLKLDPTVYDDNGATIKPSYSTYSFADERDALQMQLGMVRKLYTYASLNVEGSGGFNVTAIPENMTIPSQYQFTQPNFTLANPALDDVNVPLNATGNRLFLTFATDGNKDSWFRLQQVILGAVPDPKIPVRGY